MVVISGTTNNEPYSSVVNVSSVSDGDGTFRLCTSGGIPKEGQVSTFKIIEYNSQAIVPDLTLYTAPAFKTFYCMGIEIGGISQVPADIGLIAVKVLDVNGNIRSRHVLGAENGNSYSIANFTPLFFVPSGGSIVAYAGADVFITANPNIHINFIGYEEFGQTN